MKASTLIRKLEMLVAKHGDLKVELDAQDYGIQPARAVRFNDSDRAEWGPTIIVEGRH